MLVRSAIRLSVCVVRRGWVCYRACERSEDAAFRDSMLDFDSSGFVLF